MKRQLLSPRRKRDIDNSIQEQQSGALALLRRVKNNVPVAVVSYPCAGKGCLNENRPAELLRVMSRA